MKKSLLFICFFFYSTFFGQNLSRQGVGLITTNTPPLGIQEIFRFRPGAVGQLYSGTDFAFGAKNKWFALGRVNAGTQSFYGFRVQEAQRGLVMGYSSLNLNNPRIEWIGSSDPLIQSMGNLEFRVGDGFGGSNGPGSNTLVATMTKDGNTVFGLTNPFGNTAGSPRVGIVSSNNTALFVVSNLTAVEVQSTDGLGIFVETTDNGGFERGGEFLTSGGDFTRGIFFCKPLV